MLINGQASATAFNDYQARGVCVNWTKVINTYLRNSGRAKAKAFSLSFGKT